MSPSVAAGRVVENGDRVDAFRHTPARQGEGER